MTGATSALLVLTRHGQTVWHGDNRYAGVSDIDLTDTGRDQAVRLAAWAREHRPDAVVSSPVRRALETATASAEVLGLRPVLHEGLREVSFGIAEGHTIGELEAADGAVVERFLHDPVANAFPGADPPEAAAARGAGALREIAAQHPGGTVLVVAHNTLLRLALCQLLGIELRRYRTVFPRLDNGTLTQLRIAADGTASLLSFNAPLPPTATTRAPPSASDAHVRP